MRTINRLRIILFLVFTAIWLTTASSPRAMLTAAAILIHEVGHVVASLLIGNKLSKFFVGAAGLSLSVNRGYRSYFEEAFVAYCGPCFNFLSVLLCMAFSRSENVLFFAGVSLALGVLNLLPIKDFDGGRITEAFLYGTLRYNTAYRVSEIISFLSLFFLWSLSVYGILRSGNNLTLFFFSIILFSKMLL